MDTSEQTISKAELKHLISELEVFINETCMDAPNKASDLSARNVYHIDMNKGVKSALDSLCFP